jgi:predicted transcriptional regulator YdeE
MDYSKKHITGKKLYGLSVVISKSQSENYSIINNFWKEFNKKIKVSNLPIKNGGNWEKYGVTYKTEDIYKYFCGIPVENNYVNTFYEVFEIVDGEYAVFQHKGAMYNLKNTINKIYKEIIPNDKLDLIQNKYFHYELYNYQFKWNKNESIIEIYLPINNAKE